MPRVILVWPIENKPCLSSNITVVNGFSYIKDETLFCSMLYLPVISKQSGTTSFSLILSVQEYELLKIKLSLKIF